jgi:hypothetical protein
MEKAALKVERMKIKLLGIIVAAAISSGCASIISNSAYPVSISTSPEGASFVVTNRAGQRIESGVTPSVVSLKSSSGYFKGETYTLELTKGGYDNKIYTISSSLDGWYWGNLAFGGLLGMLIVDPATGSMFKLPERADINLSQKISGLDRVSSLTIASIDTLTDAQIATLVKLEQPK